MAEQRPDNALYATKPSTMKGMGTRVYRASLELMEKSTTNTPATVTKPTRASGITWAISASKEAVSLMALDMICPVCVDA